MKIHYKILASACVLATSITCHTAQAQQYQFQELKVLNATAWSAVSINNTGQIAGSAIDSTGLAHAVVWSGNTPAFLETGLYSSMANDINATGQAAGYVMGQSNGVRAATVWSNGALTQLGVVGNAGEQQAIAINDSGLVAGNRAPFFAGPSQAISWNGFNVTVLDNLNGRSSVATGINNAGQISGTIEGQFNPYAVVWSGSTATVLQGFADEQVRFSEANAINDAGLVVGRTSASGNGCTSAVVWQNGTPTALETPSSYCTSNALSVNNVGQAVGSYASSAVGGGGAAALWDLQTGKLVDLNTFLSATDVAAGWFLFEARDINDSGDIIGTAYNKRIGSYRPFELSVVPEPGTASLMALGMLLLVLSKVSRMKTVWADAGRLGRPGQMQ